MPYEYNPEDEENENGQGTTPPPPPPPGAQVPMSTAESGQTPFVNLQKYLQVNSDQTADLANKVANPIEQQAQSAKDKASQAKGSFQQQVQQSTVTAPTFLNQLSEGSNVSNSPTPLGVSALSQAQKDEIKQKRLASYQGPNRIEDTNLLEGSYADQQKAKERADLSATNPGRFTLLQDLVADPSYKRGQTRLDQALISGSSDAQARLGQARQKVGEVEGDIQSKISESNALVNPARQQTEATKNLVNQKLNDSVSAYMSKLQSDAAKMSEDSKKKEESVYNQLATGKLSRQAAQELGLGDDAFGNRYGVSANQFLKNADHNFDINDAATDYQRAQLEALRDLQGIENPYVGSAVANQKSGFDLSGYKKAVGDRKAEYEKKVDDSLRGWFINQFPELKDVRNSRNITIKNGGDLHSKLPSNQAKKYLELAPNKYLFVGNLSDSAKNRIKGEYEKLKRTVTANYGGSLRKV